jgi:hypothetical protein
LTGDEFAALLLRDRRGALEEYFEAWLDANSEDRRDIVTSLASLASYEGIPRIEVGDDGDLRASYDELVDNPEHDDGCGTYEVAIYFDDDGAWKHHGTWLGFADGPDEARRKAVADAIDVRIDRWKAEVIGFTPAETEEDV